MNTHITKSRLNRHRCDSCGHPVVKGRLCRVTGIDTTECHAKRVDTLRIRALRLALRGR